MNPRIIIAALASNLLAAPEFADSARAKSEGVWDETCSGEFWRVENGIYMIGACSLSEANAKKVMKVCSLGQQREITGMAEHCKGIRGACMEMTHIRSMRWGKPLPPCPATAASDRADQWWSDNLSVVVRGTIAQSEKNGSSTPPYGHTKIVMNITSCSTGSAMPIDRVPEKWIGHYVEVNGTAMKGASGWYIIARSVKDVE